LKPLIMKIILLASCFCLLGMTAETIVHGSDTYISISGSDCSDSPVSNPKDSIHLDCQTYYQTTNYTCGPAAVMTLLRFYGKLSAAQMNPKTELRIALEMGATETGTNQSQMSAWLQDHGFTINSGSRVESGLIIKNLKQNMPTIITVNRHWILAEGMEKATTPGNDVILFSDSCCGISKLSAAAIDSLWQTAELEKLHNNNCIPEGEYITATPK
jgi:hypothetical protein